MIHFYIQKKFKFVIKLAVKVIQTFLNSRKNYHVAISNLFISSKEKTLSELLHCHVNENKLDSNFCENCEACMKLLEFRLKLDDCYYYKPRTDAGFQPTRWLVYYLRDQIYMEISAVRKGKSIDWWC